MSENSNGRDEEFEAIVEGAFHPNLAELALYVNDMASPEEAQAIADHVRKCEACEERLAAARADSRPATSEETERFLALVRATRPDDLVKRVVFHLKHRRTPPVRLAARARQTRREETPAQAGVGRSAPVAPGLYRARVQPEGCWGRSRTILWCDDEGEMFLQFVPALEVMDRPQRLWLKDAPYSIVPVILAGAVAPLLHVQGVNVAQLEGEEHFGLE